MFLLLDNIDVYSSVVITRSENGVKKKNHMEHGIVIEEFFVPQHLFDAAGPAPEPSSSLWKNPSTWDIHKALPTLIDVHNKLAPVWCDHVTAALSGKPLDVLARPPATMDLQPGRTY